MWYPALNIDLSLASSLGAMLAGPGDTYFFDSTYFYMRVMDLAQVRSVMKGWGAWVGGSFRQVFWGEGG